MEVMAVGNDVCEGESDEMRVMLDPGHTPR